LSIRVIRSSLFEGGVINPTLMTLVFGEFGYAHGAVNGIGEYGVKSLKISFISGEEQHILVMQA
jgi:hypothetical protein